MRRTLRLRLGTITQPIEIRETPNMSVVMLFCRPTCAYCPNPLDCHTPASGMCMQYSRYAVDILVHRQPQIL